MILILRKWVINAEEILTSNRKPSNMFLIITYEDGSPRKTLNLLTFPSKLLTASK